MTTQSTTSAAPPKLGRWRRVSIWTLIVLASVIAVVSTLTLWVNRQMLDNNSWRKASEDVITDPEIRNSLSVYLVNQLYDNVDVAAAIENRLPEGAKSLAADARGRPAPARRRTPSTSCSPGLASAASSSTRARPPTRSS